MVDGETTTDGGSAQLPYAERLLALLAHELRTPLTPVRGFVETVLINYPDQLGSDVRELLESSVKGSERLQRVIDELLGLGRIYGEWHGGVTVVQLRAAVEEVVVAGGEEYGEVDVDVPDDLWVRIAAIDLQIILGQLLDNAVRHGAPPVRVAAAGGEASVRLRVTDSGPGVPDHFVPRMFEGFTQAAPPLSREHGGLGLGLRLVAGLAQQAGGSVEHAPALPSGTAMLLRLPRADAPSERPQPPATAAWEVAGRRALAVAHHAMGTVTNEAEAHAVLRRLVEGLGGELVGMDEIDSGTVLVDVSVGGPRRLMPSVDGPVADMLRRQLPTLLEVAELALGRGAGGPVLDGPTAAEVLWAGAVEPLRRDIRRRWEQGDAVADIVTQLLVPTLRTIGDRWEEGGWTVADQQAACGLLETLVAEMEGRERSILRSAPQVTVAGVMGDRHDLPTRLFSLMLLERGFDVRWLGTSIPAADLELELRTRPPVALLLFCSFAPLLGRAADQVAAAAAAGVPVVFGGAAVAQHPAVAARTGATVHTADAGELEDVIAAGVPVPTLPTIPWDDIVRPVRSALHRVLPPRVHHELAPDEVTWLVEAVAVARWSRDRGGAEVLEDYLGVLAGALRRRGGTDVDELVDLCRGLGQAGPTVAV